MIPSPFISSYLEKLSWWHEPRWLLLTFVKYALIALITFTKILCPCDTITKARQPRAHALQREKRPKWDAHTPQNFQINWKVSNIQVVRPQFRLKDSVGDVDMVGLEIPLWNHCSVPCPHQHRSCFFCPPNSIVVAIVKVQEDRKHNQGRQVENPHLSTVLGSGSLCCYCCLVPQSCLTLCHSMEAASQASLSFTSSRNLLKLKSIESVMLSNHLILCHPLLLLPSVFPSIRVFSKESVL